MKYARLVILFSSLILVLNSCSSTRYARLSPKPIPEYHIKDNSIRLALVLGGGGARGIAHLGVLKAFEEENIPIDLIVGTSAGSLVGAIYASHPNVAEIIPYFKGQTKRSLLDRGMNVRYGVYKGFAFRRFLVDTLHVQNFEQLKIQCIVIATDLLSGEEVAFGSGAIAPAIHASCALPYFFQPVEVYGRAFVDGGVTNPIPVSVAKKHNARVVVAVNISQDLPKTLPNNLLGVARRSLEICLNHMNKRCLKEADVVIHPPICDINIFEDNSYDILFNAGREEAYKAIPRIKELLKSHN